MADLSPEEVAALKELAKSGPLLVAEAERAHARRTGPRGFEATTRKNDWTRDETLLFVKRKQLRQELVVLARAEKRLVDAQAMLELARATAEASRADLEQFEETAKA